MTIAVSAAGTSTNRTPAMLVVLVLRSLVAVAIAAAVVGQLITSITFWTTRGDESIALNITNFFSFFTIESNILAMIVLSALVIAELRRVPFGRGFQVLLLCSTTYMVVTGIVYNILLRGIELPQGSTLGWSNEILHLIAPLWMLVDWILSAKQRDLRFRDVWAVVVFPVVWLSYTLVRGPMTLDQSSGLPFWYPYPFLNPANYDNGYGGVAVMCLCIAAAAVVVAILLVVFVRAARRAPATAT